MDLSAQTHSPASAMFGGSAGSIADILRLRAVATPQDTAFVFLGPDARPLSSLRYGALDRQARAIGGYLQARLRPGDRVLLTFPEGGDFIAAFFGCLYAGMIAVPAPLAQGFDRGRMLSRLLAIAADATPSLVLSSVFSSVLAGAWPEGEIAYTSDISLDLADRCAPVPPGADSLAYLQYTSGSTATPRGVMLRHSNLLSNIEICGMVWPHEEGTIASWLPQFHDYGLVEGILFPIYRGVAGYRLTPDILLRRPVAWLEAISRYHVTRSGGPPFGYDYCVRRILAHEQAGLDLSHWQVASIGAEPVRPETLHDFSTKFAPQGFRPEAFCPGYGLAEATLMATAVPRRDLTRSPLLFEERNGLTLTGCGPAPQGIRLAIVDPVTRAPCPDEVEGEIWLAGASVTAGYWNRPDETAATFEAYQADTRAGPFLRTGDIGFLHDGQLFVSGRIKDMIILQGQNYYPEDIEWVVRRGHPALQRGLSAVFGVAGAAEERVVVVNEVDRALSKEQAGEIFAAIRQAVAAGCRIPVWAIVLVARGSIPRTSSGKVQRYLCRAAYLEGSLPQVASWRLSPDEGR